jgi:hypothetical protein
LQVKKLQGIKLEGSAIFKKTITENKRRMFKRILTQAGIRSKNSFFIMLSSINAGFGFFFWMVAARLYSAEDVKK